MTDMKADERAAWLNVEALDLLYEGDTLAAWNLFRENAAHNVSLMTLHNLGVFYTYEGISLKNGRLRNARKLGMRYLQKAAAFQDHADLENNLAHKAPSSPKARVINLTAMAVSYLTSEEYEKSADCFDMAYAVYGEDAGFAFYNNYGKALYLLKSYDKAAAYFLKAYDICAEPDDRFEIGISCLCALFHTDRGACLCRINKMLQSGELDGRMPDRDIFALLYLCRASLTAQAMCLPLIGKYLLDRAVVAMIFDCLFECGKAEEAKECLRLQTESLKGFDYNVRGEIKSAEKAFESDEYRKKLISEYTYIPPTMPECYYIGCPAHNPLNNSGSETKEKENNEK